MQILKNGTFFHKMERFMYNGNKLKFLWVTPEFENEKKL